MKLAQYLLTASVATGPVTAVTVQEARLVAPVMRHAPSSGASSPALATFYELPTYGSWSSTKATRQSCSGLPGEPRGYPGQTRRRARRVPQPHLDLPVSRRQHWGCATTHWGDFSSSRVQANSVACCRRTANTRSARACPR